MENRMTPRERFAKAEKLMIEAEALSSDKLSMRVPDGWLVDCGDDWLIFVCSVECTER